ncbi:CMP-sialic acid transporter 2 isoform X2 [Daucus carota subsp. sativus]|uniref:CMP-sialic acid transporter 2 isoform X2 n=1 Tax=Daucus carota subsp. sativus TaxID=79200 RepID=UPI0007EF6F5A|nr:PREDICTED: CMP-sialic acid transporter 2 isoform X2 [Daucus carota subsp. sativus]
MEYRRIKDQDKSEAAVIDDLESRPVIASVLPKSEGKIGDKSKWKLKTVVTLALTFLTSSQAILIVWSKRAGKYDYSVTTANFLVEALKCALSLAALTRLWRTDGVTEDNRLSTTFDEVSVYPIPAALYLVKNLLQYYIFAYVDAPGYQILKNLNIISTGVLYRIILKRKLSEIQWAAFILLCAGCTTAQLNPSSDHVLQTPFQGWIMAIVMALLSGFAGVYTEAIIKKRPSRNINVQNFWLYVFGMAFNAVAILVQDFDAVMNKGFFHGYSLITVLMIVNHALRCHSIRSFRHRFSSGCQINREFYLSVWWQSSGIAVSMVMKYADNIVKVYSTSVAMLLTAVVSVFLFNFHLSLAFFLGSTVVSVSVYMHSIGKLQR